MELERINSESVGKELNMLMHFAENQGVAKGPSRKPTECFTSIVGHQKIFGCFFGPRSHLGRLECGYSVRHEAGGDLIQQNPCEDGRLAVVERVI